MPGTGIEPVRPLCREAAVFKSDVSTNFTTRAADGIVGWNLGKCQHKALRGYMEARPGVEPGSPDLLARSIQSIQRRTDALRPLRRDRSNTCPRHEASKPSWRKSGIGLPDQAGEIKVRASPRYSPREISLGLNRNLHVRSNAAATLANTLSAPFAATN